MPTVMRKSSPILLLENMSHIDRWAYLSNPVPVCVVAFVCIADVCKRNTHWLLLSVVRIHNIYLILETLKITHCKQRREGQHCLQLYNDKLHAVFGRHSANNWVASLSMFRTMCAFSIQSFAATCLLYSNVLFHNYNRHSVQITSANANKSS